MDTIHVIAKLGAPCPKEGKPREYIVDTSPTSVPNTSYYRRRVADGSLLIYKEPKPVKEPVKKGSKK